MTTLKSNLLKKGKKGFTLTELAIVIAVIAILIAVLVPTFSSIITKAKVSNESVACKNEWTNFYIDADIAASGTDADYLVVYTDNSYTDSNSKTYYHGYLATDGVYDTETQLDVYVDSTSGIATCDSKQYKPIGSYEYMAEGKIIIYTNKATSSVTTTVGSATFTSGTYSVTNSNLTITGYDDTYYVTGTLDTTSNTTTASSLFGDSSDGTAFYVRIYFPVKPSELTGLVKTQINASGASTGVGDLKYYGSITDTSITGNSSYANFDAIDNAIDNASSETDSYAYTDCILNGSYKQFVFDYYTSSGLAGTITIYNNAN